MNIDYLKNIKLCTTKSKKKDIEETPELKKLKMTNLTKYKLIANKKVLWSPPGQTLRVKFLNMPNDFKPLLDVESNITVLNLTDSIKTEGVIKYGKDFDPLQLEFNKALKDIYSLNQSISPINLQILIKDYIKRCINERWAPFVNLNFQFVNPDEDAEIRFSLYEGGPGSSGATVMGKLMLQKTLCGATSNNTWTWTSNSEFKEFCKPLGYIASRYPPPTKPINGLYANETQKQPTINISSFSISTVLHEFGHALGFDHEHQSPCGRNIQWNLPLLYSWGMLRLSWTKEQIDDQIVNVLEKNNFIGSSYDRDSIMIYYYPGELTLNGIGTPKILRLSPNDCITASLLYPKNPQMTIEKIKELYLQMYPENILPFDVQNQFSIRSFELKKDGFYNITNSSSLNIWHIISISIGILVFIIGIVIGLNKKYKFF